MEKLNERDKHILDYINKMGYTWSLESIENEYEKFKRNEYVSYTAKKVITLCIEPFEKLYDEKI